MDKLRELNLLTAKHVGQTIGGEDKAYANFISIDGDVLKNLSNDQLLEPITEVTWQLFLGNYSRRKIGVK